MRLVQPTAYKRHLSPFLQWFWHFQDFRIAEVTSSDDASRFQLHFVPRYGLANFLVDSMRGPLRLSLPATVRLANIAAIIAAGLKFGKAKQDGDVIARDMQISCDSPIVYRHKDTITVTVTIEELGESSRFNIYNARFDVGPNAEHHGIVKHYYCKPRAVRDGRQ